MSGVIRARLSWALLLCIFLQLSVTSVGGVDGKKGLTPKQASKVLKTLAKAVEKVIERPDVKPALDKLRETSARTLDDHGMMDARMKIIAPLLQKSTKSFCEKYGLGHFFDLFQAALNSGKEAKDQEVTHLGKRLKALIEDKPPPDRSRAEDHKLFKQLLHKARDFPRQTTKADKEELLAQIEELAQQISDPTESLRAADAIDAMRNMLSVGDSWVEDTMVELAPEMAAATPGSPEHRRLIDMTKTYGQFLDYRAMARVDQRINPSGGTSKARNMGAASKERLEELGIEL